MLPNQFGHLTFGLSRLNCLDNVANPLEMVDNLRFRNFVFNPLQVMLNGHNIDISQGVHVRVPTDNSLQIPITIARWTRQKSS